MVSIGCVIKDPGSTRNNKTGSWRTFKPILDKDKCVDCDNCIYSALRAVWTRNMISITTTARAAVFVRLNVRSRLLK
jgi:Pyruvate/2-oxoacid:ferredoxin oxidoreductase delta subunit